MHNTDISMPIAKASSAITVAVAAKSDAPEQIARAATQNSTYETWMWVNSIPWGDVAQFVAAIYTSLLILEWFWKKFWRPILESKGWIKPRRPRIITLKEFEQMSETERGEL